MGDVNGHVLEIALEVVGQTADARDLRGGHVERPGPFVVVFKRRLPLRGKGNDPGGDLGELALGQLYRDGIIVDVDGLVARQRDDLRDGHDPHDEDGQGYDDLQERQGTPLGLS
jgi:hypothetical protein